MPDVYQNLSIHHVIVPCAAVGTPEQDPSERPSWPNLPHLAHLLSRLQPQPLDAADEYSLTPPHERARARALGLVAPDKPFPDGRVPWAAFQAGVTHAACAWFTPCHWQVGMEHVTLQPPDDLALDEATSRALFDALRPWAEEDGITLVFEHALRWRAEGPAFADLPCASLDRVAHRRLDAWLPDGEQTPQAKPLLRLQNEAQMLFYTHAANDARSARGLTPINGLWISGAGAWNGQSAATAPTVLDALRKPALQGDWGSWRSAWSALDQGPVADLLTRAEHGDPVQLTLCGERHAQTWVTASTPPGWRQRLASWWHARRHTNPASHLNTL